MNIEASPSNNSDLLSHGILVPPTRPPVFCSRHQALSPDHQQPHRIPTVTKADKDTGGKDTGGKASNLIEARKNSVPFWEQSRTLKSVQMAKDRLVSS